MTTPTLETEAKFIIPDAATFETLQKLRQLGAFKIEPLGTKHMVDRYVDTLERVILQAGYACRLRRVGPKKLLSLKTLTPPEGNIHRRQELEIAVDSDNPATWPLGEATTTLRRIVGEAPLQTLFVIEQKRYKYRVQRGDRAVIELSLDQVAHGGDDRTSYFELEAELIEAGDEADLHAFITDLQTQFSLQAETASKFERALLTTQIVTKREDTMFALTDVEKLMLRRIAGSADELLAKRAAIILHSQAGDSPETVAEKVGFTLRTVNKWRQAFAEKRLDIFPVAALSVPEPEPVSAVETELDEAVIATTEVEPQPVAVVEPVEVKTDKADKKEKGKKQDRKAKEKAKKDKKGKKDKKKDKKKNKKDKKDKKKKKK